MAIAPWVRFLGLSGLKPDIVHFEWNFAAVAHLPLYDFFGAPVVVSCRGSQIAIAPTSPSRSNLNSCLKESLRRADRVHAVSDATKRLALAAGAEPSRTVVIRPAVESSFFRVLPRLRDDKQTLWLISVGSLGWVKGYEFGLQALRYALDEGVDLHWKIVGGGTHQERQRLLYTIEDLNLVGRVRLAGELPSCSVQACLKSADIFLLPSLSEGISNAALEAMATGLPVVASNVGGMSEAVVHGESGLLVPPRDGRAMAEAILLLTRDPQLHFELGQRAREHVERHFSLERQADEWAAVYCDLLTQNAASRHRVDAAPPPLQNVPHSTASGE